MSGVNYLELSDEEVMQMTAPPAAETTQAGDTTGATSTTEADATQTSSGDVTEGGTTEADTDTGGEAEGSQDQDQEGSDQDKTPGAASTGEGDGGASQPATEQGAAATQTTAEEKSPDGDKSAAAGSSAIDYEKEYKRLLAPFRANGRDIQVESVDDAINLMQMGANYNKKMAALKPNLKLLKLLENNGLLSEEKISFMIDLGKKNPGAINKLVKESGIDPMDLNAEQASAYKQTAYAVDDREIELDTVLDEIQGSQTYTRTLDVVSNKWDAASKQVIAQTPQLLKVINDHMTSGIYDLISAGIERERMFGRLTGMSDLEAYKHVGDAIQARGGFNHLFQNKGQGQAPGSVQGQSTPSNTKPVTVQPKPKVEDATLNDRRRAASPTQSAAPTTTPKDFNPLAMSDEEFNKLAAKRFR